MSSTFLTQPRVNVDEYAAEESNDLEAVVSGATQTSQSTLLLKKRKKMREMDDALERKKEEYNAKMQAFAERQRKFEQAQTKLREQVAELAPFLQENDAKRAKALKRAKDEEEARASAESKLERMRASLQEMQDQKRELEHRLQRLRRYEDFLQRVVDSHSADSYGEIADVLNRHRTLDTAYSELKRDVHEKEGQMDHLRDEIRSLSQAVQNRVLVQNSEIHKSQKTLEALRAEWFKHELRKEHSERLTKDKIREAGQVVMAIRNLHARCVSSSLVRLKQSAPADKKAPSEAQLVDSLHQVKHRLEDLQSIAEAWETAKLEMGTREQGSGAAASVAGGSHAGVGSVRSGATQRKKSSSKANSSSAHPSQGSNMGMGGLSVSAMSESTGMPSHRSGT